MDGTFPNWSPLMTAVVATAMICGGSIVGIAAPGDGQTGMFMFPQWGLGAGFGVIAIIRCLKRPVQARLVTTVLSLALLALGSVIWSFKASADYSREWQIKHLSQGIDND